MDGPWPKNAPGATQHAWSAFAFLGHARQALHLDCVMHYAQHSLPTPIVSTTKANTILFLAGSVATPFCSWHGMCQNQFVPGMECGNFRTHHFAPCHPLSLAVPPPVCFSNREAVAPEAALNNYLCSCVPGECGFEPSRQVCHLPVLQSIFEHDTAPVAPHWAYMHISVGTPLLTSPYLAMPLHVERIPTISSVAGVPSFDIDRH